MKRGFTLIETFVAIVILMLAVGTQIVISQRGIASAAGSREHLVAQYLASDGLEILRMLRDNNVLAIANGDTGVDWLNNMWEPCGNNQVKQSKCYAVRQIGSNGDLTAPGDVQLRSCTGTCPTLKLHPVSGVYDPSVTGTQTTFIRTMWLEYLGNDPTNSPTEEVRAVVEIKWRTTNQERTIKLTDVLYNRGI